MSGDSDSTSQEPKDIETWAANEDSYRKFLKAERESLKAKAEVRELKRVVNEQETQLERLAMALALYEQKEPVDLKWAIAKQRRKAQMHRGTLIGFVSDTHYGEVVSLSEMNGFNAYNMDIAELRTQALFERFITIPAEYLKGVEYDGFILALNGDIVSGDIHDELRQTNQLSTYATVQAVLPWLATGIKQLLEVYPKVHVVSAPGNHGRDSHKPRHKKRSEHNADTHIAQLLRWRLEDEKRLTFDIPASFDVKFSVYDSHFSMEHGDNYRSNSDSIIGSLGPVKRGTYKKRTQAQIEGTPFQYNLVSHFHQYVAAQNQGFIMNGSLKGYDEYARSGGFIPEDPQQALMLVTPENGITMNVPVFVADHVREGW
jgi:hypothetical protein